MTTCLHLLTSATAIGTLIALANSSAHAAEPDGPAAQPVVAEAEAEPELIERTSLRIGIQNERPFFSYLDEYGYRAGFDVDIAYAICDALEVECELEPMAYPQIIPALQEKRIDAAVASMPITEEHDEQVDFTAKYYETQVRFVASDNADFAVSEDGLTGRTLGVVRGSALDNYATEKFWPKARLARYGTEDEMWIDLSLGRLDTVLADVITARSSFLGTDLGDGFTFKGAQLDAPEHFGEGAGVAVREGEEELLADLNQAIAEIVEGEGYDEIRSRYFAYDIYGSDPSGSSRITQGQLTDGARGF